MQELKLSSEFNISNAHSLALLSQLAYQSEHRCRNKLHQWRFNHCEFISKDETQCFIAEHSEYTVIAFRGTEMKIEDWITDLQFYMQKQTAGPVHSGFDRALNNIWPLLIRQVSQNKPVFITGHSLGAALAVLCAMRLRMSGIDVQAIYTYGQPRIGGTEFAENYNCFLRDRSYRIVNNNDIVTRVPPRILGYSHCCTLKYFTEKGELSDNMSAWSQFLDRINGRVEDVLEWGSDGIKDHSIDVYVQLCQALHEQNEPAFA